MDIFIYCIVPSKLFFFFSTYGNTTPIIDFLFLAGTTTGLRNRFRALMIRIDFWLILNSSSKRSSCLSDLPGFSCTIS